MRIIGIVGIWDFRRLYAWVWGNLESEFAKKFPGAGFTVEHLWYSPWQGKKMRSFCDSIVADNDRGGDIILVGWSMGGVVATAIAPRFKRSRVVAVVTLFSPHTFLFGLFSRMLNSSVHGLGQIPVVSFSARLDQLVLWGTRYPKAVRHLKMWSDHLFCLIFSTKTAAAAAREAARLFQP